VSVALIKRPRGQAVGSVPQCVLVDCGKTFRDSVMNLFPKHGLREVTGLVLTHGHADAILGLDDVRDVQTFVVSTCHQPV
jgi:glyoxylase-like metal-dependent hydrolase (beta-lactamase superfamily II)